MKTRKALFIVLGVFILVLSVWLFKFWMDQLGFVLPKGRGSMNFDLGIIFVFVFTFMSGVVITLGIAKIDD